MPNARLVSIFIFLAAVLGAGLSGCASTSAPLANPSQIPEARYLDVFQEAGILLRDRGFVIDRQDLRYGLVSSRPRISPTVFEPWSSNNTTGDQVLASTVSNLRRIVRIWIQPTGMPAPTTIPADAYGPDPIATTQSDSAVSKQAVAVGRNATGPYTVRVEVLVERGQQPTRRLSGSVNSGSEFNDLKAVPTELSRRGIDGMYWEPVGHDSYFEQRLLKELLERTDIKGGQ